MRSGPFIVPVFIPHAGCPHRCVFCDQQTITGTSSVPPSPEDIDGLIRSFLMFKGPHRLHSQISFYGGNFLGLPAGMIRQLLKITERFVRSGSVGGLRFSTRPDTVTEDRLDLIREFPVATVEIGAQSMDDAVLAVCRRGHRASDTVRAVAAARRRGYQTGLQMMVGLPGETPENAIRSGREMVSLRPDFVRIYPTLVLKNSRLADWYEKGRYVPLPLDKSVALVKTLYRMFEAEEIPVIRMGLQISKDLGDGASVLAGPYHPAFGHLVFSEIFLDQAIRALTEAGVAGAAITLRVHPRSIPRMRGPGNANLKILKKKFGLEKIAVLPDDGVSEMEVRVSAFPECSSKTGITALYKTD